MNKSGLTCLSILHFQLLLFYFFANKETLKKAQRKAPKRLEAIDKRDVEI
jgi:hypothetical protein